MNLAEIRKKARKEQKVKEEGADLTMALTEEIEPETEVVIPSDAGSLPDFVPAPPEDIAGPAMMPESEAEPVQFDPLSVLLAGRNSSTAERDQHEGPLQQQSSSGEEFQEFLCFRVSSEIYAINIMAIKEIIKPREVTEIPRAPDFVAGVLSLRGIIIPIFNMRLRLGLPEAEKSGKERIIVVSRGEEFMGILVDEVTQVVRIVSATIEKPPAVLDGIDRDFVSGIGRFNNQMLILLHQENILDISLG